MYLKGNDYRPGLLSRAVLLIAKAINYGGFRR